MHDMNHLDFLEDVARFDIETLRRKESTYKGSWKRRGGVGAFMMLARKWDRLEQIMGEHYQLFDACLADPSAKDGSALAEVRDLRQYLMLVEAEIQSRIAKGNIGKLKEVYQPERTPVEIYTATHSDSSHGAEFPLSREEILASRKNAPCGSYHSQVLGGVCQDCGHPKVAHSVPVEDSSRHAERANDDWRAGKKVDGVWKVKPIISADVYRRIQDPELKARFILTGSFAHVNRKLYPEKERESLFKRLPQTHTNMSFQGLGLAEKEFYEPREGVEGEWQMKKEFREVWGA